MRVSEAFIYTRLNYQHHPPISHITLKGDTGPDLALAVELGQAAQQTQEDDARVVVLGSDGANFCVGRAELTGPGDLDARRWLEMHRCASAVATIPVPVIAAINGDALDQGLEIALACDLRIAAEGARLGITDLSRGNLSWDGCTQRLTRLAGRALALEMLLTGRILDAREALKAGLVNMVVAPQELADQTEQLAAEVATRAPIALRYAKEAVLKGADLPFEQALGLEADLNIILQSTRDRAEGLRSFLEKRPPRFTGE